MSRLFTLLCCLLMVSASSCVDGKVARLEESVEENRNSVIDLRTLQADYSVALERLRAEVRRLSGKVEELEYLSKGKTARLERALERFSSRVPPPLGVPEKVLAQDEEMVARIQGPDADTYRSGLGMLRAGEFTEAVQLFTRFGQSQPASSFTDNALFWIGIASEKLGDYDRALVAYSEVFQRFPKEDRAPAALFHMAQVFSKQQDRTNEIATYEKLVDDYPESEFAEQAKKLLRSRKKR